MALETLGFHALVMKVIKSQRRSLGGLKTTLPELSGYMSLFETTVVPVCYLG